MARLLSPERREHILDAATRVFADKGYERATIHDVARAASVADGTIYNYFPNKLGLLLGILHRLNETERRPRDLATVHQSAPEDGVTDYLRHRFQVFEGLGLDVFRVVLPELLNNPELRATYQQEVLEPTFALADAIAPPLVARAMAGMVLGTLVLRLLDDPLLAAHWSEMPDVLARFSLYGMRGVPA